MANIWIIDDELVLLDLISLTLRREGHVVTAMSDPLAAIDSFGVRKQPFDLLLTDVCMKPISGFEFVKRLNETGFHGPVLFMSGYPALISTIAGPGDTHDVLDKPFNINQLLAAVDRILAQHKQKCRGRHAADSI
jgi:DNA-binding response OmpR family regulator